MQENGKRTGHECSSTTNEYRKLGKISISIPFSTRCIHVRWCPAPVVKTMRFIISIGRLCVCYTFDASYYIIHMTFEISQKYQYTLNHNCGVLCTLNMRYGFVWPSGILFEGFSVECLHRVLFVWTRLSGRKPMPFLFSL